MKKLLFIFLISCFGILQIYAQQEWYWQNPKPVANAIFGVSFINEQEGWAVGDGWMILHTTNGGTTWEWQDSNIWDYNITHSRFEDICFINENYGTVVGMNGLILRTSDGGENWIQQNSGTTAILNDVSFYDVNNGIIAGESVLLVTSDGGQNWVNKSPPDFGFNSVCYLNANLMVTTGGLFNRYVYTSADGGTNWYSKVLSTYLNTIQFISTNVGFAGGVGKIYRTLDGGLNWSEYLIPINIIIESLYFTDQNIGTVITGREIYTTTDGGANWTEKISGLYFFRDISFGNSQTGTVVGDYGVVFKTTNSGQDWYSQYYNAAGYEPRGGTGGSTTSGLRGVNFSSFNTATVVGDLGTILRTTDGGISWIKQESGLSPITVTQSRLNAVAFADDNLGVVAGYFNILRTTDAGQNWLAQSISAEIFDVSLINVENGIAVGSSGRIFRTTDGGISWDFQTSGVTSTLYGVSYANANDILVVGASGRILKSTDGGTNWVLKNSGTTRQLNDVHYIDENTATVVGSNSTILRTTDGGETWTQQTNPYNFPGLAGVYFSDINSGVITGAGGYIIYTTDGGENWLPAYSKVKGNNHGIQDVTISSSNKLIAVGHHGIIITSQGVASVNNNPQFISPTPVNGSTFTVNVGAQFIFTVAAEDIDAGDIVTLTVSGLPSGSVMNPLLPEDGNPVSSDFSWTPTSSDVGTYEIIYSVTDPLGAQSQCSINIEVPVPICPNDLAYWKGNPATWPPSALPMMLGTSNTYDQTQLLSILNQSIRGDASLILSRQLIPAILNIAQGSPLTPEVVAAIEDADNAIGILTVPGNIRPSTALGSQMELLALILEEYNKNLLTPDCVLPKISELEEERVTEYELFSNYPNPFNPSTKISWQSPVDGHQTLKVFDVLGNEVAILVDEFRPAGRYEATFDASNLASGIYIYKLQAGDFVQNNKMILMK